MATKTKTAGEAQTPEAGIVSAGAEQAAEQTAPGREANQAEEAREQTSPASVETPETSADREKEAEAPALDILELWRRGREDRLAAARLRHLGYVLQVGGLLPFLSAGENILLPCRTLGNLAAQRESVRELTERLHIERLLRQMPSTLSVGERQRVAIARALAHGPSILLADEPTAALDPQHARLVLGLLAELAGERGTTVIMVTHAPDMAEEAGFRLVRVMTAQDREGAPFSRIRHSDGEAA